MNPDFRRAMALYALTGVTGLAYEVLWVRLIGTLFGTSQIGVVVTVAAFMLGLGIGAIAGRGFAARIRRPLLAFAALESVVALHALLLPIAVDALADDLMRLGGGLSLPLWIAIELAVVLVVLVLPAIAMGAGFPLILLAASGDGRHLGSLYGINAVGAALGALLPLLLLPLIGWAHALQLIAALGLGVAAWAALSAVRLRHRGSTGTPEADDAVRGGRRGAWIAYGGIGMAAIMLEIAWTRFYSLLMLRTEYVLAVILAVYVLGIGIGGLLGQRLPVRRSLDAIPFLIVVLVGGGLWAAIGLAGWIEAHDYGSLAEALFVQGGLLMLLTLPVTVLLGAWLPLLHRLPGAGRLAGVELYAVNAAGSAIGALLAGLVLIPLLGTTAVICVAAIVLFVCGLYWSGRRPLVAALGGLAIAAVVPLWVYPAVSRLLPQSQAGTRDLYRYEDALATTHVVERRDGQRLLLSDLQRMDAASDPASVASQQDQARLALWLHPSPGRLLMLGLGTGITAAGTLSRELRQRTAVELSRGAIVAAREWFGPVNDGVVDRIEVVNDDVRRYLIAHDDRYDVIIGDLFHPDLVGRGALLSRQEFVRVRKRLAVGGLYVQWLALNQFDRQGLEVVLRTFGSVFPGAMLFVDGFRLALVGPSAGWQGPPIPTDGGQDPVSGAPPVDRSEDAWTWAGRYWGWPGLPPGPVEDEWRPRIEYALPRARYEGRVDLVSMIDWLESKRPSLEESLKRLGVDASGRRRFERAYMATGLALRSWKTGLLGRPGEADRLLRFARQANPGDRWIAWTLADRLFDTLPEAIAHGVPERRALAQIQSIMPGHPETLARLWHLEDRAGDRRRADALLERLRRLSPLGYRRLIADTAERVPGASVPPGRRLQGRDKVDR